MKDEIRDVKEMIASGFEETNTTRLEKVVKEMKDEIKNEVDLRNHTRLEDVFNEIKDVKALLESGTGDINEMRLEDILKEVKDLKNLIAPTLIECDAVHTSKQALISALVCEYLVCF